MKGDEERCLAAGMDGYLPKPIQGRALSALLERIRGRAGEIEARATAAG
jgi:CheY-like chemotaxis protein